MMADHLTKNGTPSEKEFKRVLQENVINLQNKYVRPRPSQRAHSFGTFFDFWSAFGAMRVILDNPDEATWTQPAELKAEDLYSFLARSDEEES